MRLFWNSWRASQPAFFTPNLLRRRDLAASTALPLGRPPQRTQRVRLRGPRGTRLRVTRLVSTAIFTASLRSSVKGAGYGLAEFHFRTRKMLE
jgi:hypothetical protein